MFTAYMAVNTKKTSTKKTLDGCLYSIKKEC